MAAGIYYVGNKAADQLAAMVESIPSRFYSPTSVNECLTEEIVNPEVETHVDAEKEQSRPKKSEGKQRPAMLQLYPERPETCNFDCAKAPGLNDRKRVHIDNIEPFAIDQPRELSRGPNSKFQAARGIPTEEFEASVGMRSKKEDQGHKKTKQAPKKTTDLNEPKEVKPAPDPFAITLDNHYKVRIVTDLILDIERASDVAIESIQERAFLLDLQISSFLKNNPNFDTKKLTQDVLKTTSDAFTAVENMDKALKTISTKMSDDGFVKWFCHFTQMDMEGYIAIVQKQMDETRTAATRLLTQYDKVINPKH